MSLCSKGEKSIEFSRFFRRVLGNKNVGLFCSDPHDIKIKKKTVKTGNEIARSNLLQATFRKALFNTKEGYKSALFLFSNWSMKFPISFKLLNFCSLWETSLVAQLVKNLPAMWETRVWSLGWKDPLEKGKASHSSILAWRIQWTV